MEIPLFQVDAFSAGPFTGNPAAVCLLGDWLPDSTLQAIAQENNLSETAFVVRTRQDRYQLRWFTPQVEVDLCGHATLAAAFVLLYHTANPSSQVQFDTRSGLLQVSADESGLRMDLPADQLIPVSQAALDEFENILHTKVLEAVQGRSDILLLVEDEQAVRQLKPDIFRMRSYPFRGFIATAPGTDSDFVSRFFCPAVGIDEDPVTGSAHTTLAAFWTSRLKKAVLQARQLSARGGWLRCQLAGERVFVWGTCGMYLKATAFIQ